MNRTDHLAAARKRALELAKMGQLVLAYNSIVSDLLKHPETAEHPNLETLKMMFLTDKLNTKESMIKFIMTFT